MPGRNLGSFGAVVEEITAPDEPDTFTFYGETFTVAQHVGALPLMRFAAAARTGAGSDDLAGLSAMYDMIRDCLAPGDFERFDSVATANKADGATILAVCSAVYEALAGRPTTPQSTSSAGQRPTTKSSQPKSGRGRRSGLPTKPVPATVVDFGTPVQDINPDDLRTG